MPPEVAQPAAAQATAQATPSEETSRLLRELMRLHTGLPTEELSAATFRALSTCILAIVAGAFCGWGFTQQPQWLFVGFNPATARLGLAVGAVVSLWVFLRAGEFLTRIFALWARVRAARRKNEQLFSRYIIRG